MSLAGLSSISPNASSTTTSFAATRRQDTGQLFAALESGDLAGAQAAYAQLAKLGGSTTGNPFTGPKLTKDFAAIGQALQNGDLAGAQESALQLGQDLVAANQQIRNRGIEPLVPPGSQSSSAVVNLSSSGSGASPASNTAPATTASPAASSAGSTASGSVPEIVINLGGTNPSIDLNVNGSQVDINLATAGAAGGSPSAIDLNFGSAAAGSQIEINLANNGSGNSSETLGINIVA